MAAAQFPFNGQTYQVDDQGTIYEVVNGQWQPVTPLDQSNVALQQAAAAAQSGQGNAAPASKGVPVGTTVPNWQPTPGSTGAPDAATPAAATPPPAPADTTATPPATPPASGAPSLPATPPRAGVGSATELRTQRDAVQKQLDQLTSIPVEDRTNAQNTLLSSLETRVSSLTDQITKAEAPKEGTPKTVRQSYASEAEPYVIVDNGDGTITAQKNPNYTGQVRAQVATSGNNTLVITPPTADELAANPQAAPHVTVAFTNTDAQALADRTTAVAEANAKTAAAAQATNDFAAHAKADLDAQVAAGGDAASIRAEQALKLQELYQQWQMADGDRKTAEQALTDYNANRHNIASEQLTKQQLDQTAAAQAAQDATTRRGQDIAAQTSQYATQTQAATSKYSTDVGAQTARLQTGAQFLGNALTLLANINKDLPPGSGLAGAALPGLLAAGQKFMEGIAGQLPAYQGPAAPTGPRAPGDIAPVLPTGTPDTGVNPLPVAPGSDQTQSGTPAAPPPPGPSGVPQGGTDWLFNSAASPIANPANSSPVTPATAPSALPDISSQVATGNAAAGAAAAQLQQQNDAAHQANLEATRAQVFGPLTADGSPLATPADVARVWGRAA